VRTRYVANLKIARRNDFHALMTAAILYHDVKTLRVHVSGDFFSAAYVKHWIRIAKACPHVDMWTYTRSWRVPKLQASLEQLASLPNFKLWWSVDREMGLPGNIAIPPGVRIAYLQVAKDDIPETPVDLVFRTHALRKIKESSIKTPGQRSEVCAAETGLKNADSVHCADCRVCIDRVESVPSAGRVALPMVA
jgi:hypothetical protein